MRAYLDHASASPLRPEVIDALRQVLEITQADPGRPYEEAIVIRDLIEDARREVARLARVTPRQIVFTSSIAESATTAVRALARGGSVVAAATERSSVLDAAARHGSVISIGVDRDGHVDTSEVEERVADPGVTLVCCQAANHETGVRSDLGTLIEIAHRRGVAIHVDATMLYGHDDALDLGALDADAVTITGELIGAPLGSAAVVVRKGHLLEGLIVGGSQERGRRAGLEPLLSIVGFGVAAGVLLEPGVLVNEARLAALFIHDLEEAALAVDGVLGVGDPLAIHRAPQVRCFTVTGVEAEPVLMGLDRRGVSIHSGSACSSESLEPSPVLGAMGLEASQSLRVSVGWSSTAADVDRFASAFPEVVASLRSLVT